MGQDADGEPGHGGGLDAGHAGAAVGHPPGAPGPIQCIHGRGPVGAALGEDRERQRLGFVRRLAARRGPDQGLAAQRPAAHAFALLGDQRQVEFAGVERTQEVPAAVAMDLELDPGIGAGEARQDAGQEIGRRVGGAQAQAARDRVLAEVAECRLVERQHAPGVAEQDLAVRGQRDLPARAVEQALAGDVFQALDLHGDRRLHAPQAPGGAGEAAGLGDRHEGAQEIDVEVRERGHKSRYMIISIKTIRLRD